MFGWFFRKKEIEKLRDEAKNSFEHVKKDISKIGNWINHLNDHTIKHNSEIDFIKQELSSIKEELEELKDFVSIFGNRVSKQLSKPSKQLSKVWTGVQAVQTGVQTPVQRQKFDDFFNFSVVERAILWVLLNSDLKLSYEDISLILGKERSTIRSQINSIKQKSNWLIEEIMEKNGKKRVFIPDEIKERLLKNAKVRVRFNKKSKKDEKGKKESKNSKKTEKIIKSERKKEEK